MRIKKKIIIALVSSLGFCSGTSAASPFSTVYVNDWQYKSMEVILKSGMVQGYSSKLFEDGTPTTRYEVAQIVANALTYTGEMGTDVQNELTKLKSEFAPELKRLGIDAATGNVEEVPAVSEKPQKKGPNLVITGDSRIRWQSNYGLNGRTVNGVHTKSTDRFQSRVRLLLNSDINEKLSFEGIIGWQNQNGASGTDTKIGRNSVAQMEKATFTFKNIMPHMNFSLGRMGDMLGATGVAWDVQGGWFDGVRVNYNHGSVKAMLGYGDMGAQQDSGLPAPSGFGSNWSPQAATVGQISWAINKTATVYAAGIYSNADTYRIKDNILGIKMMGNNLCFSADYVHNSWNFDNQKVNPNASYYKLTYRGASPTVPGSWGLYIDYRKIGGQSIDTRLTTLNVAGSGAYGGFVDTADGLTNTGIKGFGYGFTYGLSKNATLLGTVETLKSYDGQIKFDNFYSLTTFINF